MAAAAVSAQSNGPTFEVQSANFSEKSFTGRVYVFFAPPSNSARGSEPRLASPWFAPHPVVAWDVEQANFQSPWTISWGDPRLKRYPRDLQPAQLSGMAAQAMIRLNPLDPEVPMGVGNAYGPAVVVGRSETIKLEVKDRVPQPAFPDTLTRKHLIVPSKLLSDFAGREVQLQAAVHLPSDYASSKLRYPVILEIPGFGGDHRRGMYQSPAVDPAQLGVEFIRVVLDPRCPLGHHVFANSANNGPWGDALIQEFLPALDARYRTFGTTDSRFLCGHSSGGWSSLWLMVNYPEHFGGTWSTSPDPVDFRDFQQINISADRNMFFDSQRALRPLARRDGRMLVTYKTFSDVEDVLGPGGQLNSFEAVFSPRGSDGRPLSLWNRETGAIDPAVADSWQKYDIRRFIEQNWSKLSPALRGKLHIYMGTEDTFYLNGATVLLKESLARLGSDAVVELLPGKDHSTVFQGGLRGRIEQSMAARHTSLTKTP